MATKRTKKKSTVPKFVLPVGTGSSVTRGRAFNQPLASAPPDTVAGVEFTLANDFSLFACFEGYLAWTPAQGTATPSRLTITIDGITIKGRLRALQTLEAPVVQIIYENLDATTLQTNLEKIINDAYAETIATPNDTSAWHPSMRQEKYEKKKLVVAHSMLKDRLDSFGPSPGGDPARKAEVTKIVSEFIAKGRPTLQIAVRPGDHLADAAGPSHRVIVYMIDAGDQKLNPLFYMHLYTHAPATKIDFTGPLAGHPLAVAFPELTGATAPPPRVLVNSQDQFVLGPLKDVHNYPEATSTWNYGPTGEIAIDGAVAEPTTAETNKARAVWTDLGGLIGPQARELRVPCELATSLFVHESGGSQMNFRFEPLNDKTRPKLSGVPDLVREYDKMVGIRVASVTAVKRLPATKTFGEPPVTRLSVQLAESSPFSAARLLKSKRKRLLIDDVFRPDLAAIKGSGKNFDFDIKEERFSGKVKQSGQAETTPMTTAIKRAGKIRVVRVRVNKKVDKPVTVSLIVNNNTAQPSLVLSVPANAPSFEDLQGSVDVVNGDTVSVKVNTLADTGQLEADLEWFLGLPDPAPSPNVFLLVGANPSSTGVNVVPVPWNSELVVRTQSTLTWGQVADLLDEEAKTDTHTPKQGGSFMSPGIAQTLVVVAMEILERIKQYDPTIIQRVGLTPVTKASDMIRGTTQDEENAGTPPRRGWLFERQNAIFVGLVKMRLGYRDDNTRWDMPRVAANYNNGHIASDPGSKTGMVLNNQEYPDKCAHTYNALVRYFDGSSVTPAQTVRLKP
jgi:hypothetical protein